MNKQQRVLVLQIGLFVLTIITTTLAGIEWVFGRSVLINSKGEFGWNDWITIQHIYSALLFSISFLGILTIHEFGHYFTAQFYKIKTSLPYYIPFWFGVVSSIGTMGAFIRIKDQIQSRKHYFDVGLAGPLAGFLAALLVIWYGFTHLPPQTYIFSIHPEYMQYGLDYANYVYKNLPVNFYLGNNLLFWFFENYVADPNLVPNHYEMMHYPLLFAGYLSCFFTALNLMPIGQLDGGHILYGLLGEKKHNIVSTTLFILFVFYAGLGMVTPTQLVNAFDSSVLLYLVFLYFIFIKLGKNLKNIVLIALSVLTAQFATSYFLPNLHGYNGWLLFAFILGRFMGINHPKANSDEPLDLKRKALGWFALVIFVICFTPTPFVFE
jgi:membrane-associated protease RseP (regulator of RpoE activity)